MIPNRFFIFWEIWQGLIPSVWSFQTSWMNMWKVEERVWIQLMQEATVLFSKWPTYDTSWMMNMQVTKENFRHTKMDNKDKLN